MSSSTTIAPVEFCDAFSETLCKLKALELILNSGPIHEALDADAVAGIAYLFGDVIAQFDTLHHRLTTV